MTVAFDAEFRSMLCRGNDDQRVRTRLVLDPIANQDELAEMTKLVGTRVEMTMKLATPAFPHASVGTLRANLHP